MVDFNEISPRDLQKLLESKGKRGADAISVLAKKYPYLNEIFNTEIGRNILSKDLNDFDALIEKIVDEKANPEELAEFRVIKRRILQLSETLRGYLTQVDQVKKALDASKTD